MSPYMAGARRTRTRAPAWLQHPLGALSQAQSLRSGQWLRVSEGVSGGQQHSRAIDVPIVSAAVPRAYRPSRADAACRPPRTGQCDAKRCGPPRARLSPARASDDGAPRLWRANVRALPASSSTAQLKPRLTRRLGARDALESVAVIPSVSPSACQTPVTFHLTAMSWTDAAIL